MKKNDVITGAAFSLTLFLSAGLMFAVQPMVGKMLLPLVGGTPAGWIVAMAFFQTALLCGYLLAHGLSRFSARTHALLFIGGLCLGCFFLPVRLAAGDVAGNLHATDIFRLLAITVGIPFIALSAASSTIQRLFTTTHHASAHDPYFLYAASNLGSFAGLLLYPLAVEPLLGLAAQTHIWLWWYGALIALCVLCLLLSRNAKAEKITKPAVKVSLRQKLEWLGLAFIPSSMMLGVTSHITTDVFSAPMIWVLPLGVYLLTMVVAFAKKQVVSFRQISQLHSFFVAAGIFLLLLPLSEFKVSWSGIFVYLMIYGGAALYCHMRLANLRPQDNRHLTLFYLMMALGGALGGLLNAFIVPLIFTRVIEYQVMLILSLLLNPVIRAPFRKGDKTLLGLALVFAAVYLAAVVLHLPHDNLVANIAITVVFFLMAMIPRSAFICGMIMLIIFNIAAGDNYVIQERNFYGVLRVRDTPVKTGNIDTVVRRMSHGTTVHGLEIMDPKYQKSVLSYYSKGSGVSDAIRVYAPKRVAVIGLGAGTLNCYNAPDRSFTFFDINPAVIDIAEHQFKFLTACRNKQPPEIILGDGRLAMGKLDGQKFDMIILDAFTADAIPMHLLTVEALQVYLDHLDKGGQILIHVSNRYFDLAPILARNAREIGGLVVRIKKHMPDDPSGLMVQSNWVLMARNGLDPSGLMGWKNIKYDKKRRPWTDDYTNLLGTLTKYN